MKAASLALKIVAILAAAFSVYAWIDTKGIISTAESNMKGVSGATLAEKAPKIPGILKTVADQKKSIDAFNIRVASLEKNNNSLNSELEGERAKSVTASAEIVKKNSEIRTLTESLASSQKTVAEKDSLVENLKREIIATKALVAQTGEADALKEKVSALETKLGDSSKALEDAQKKIKLLESAEVVQVVETDAAGNKVIKKVIKTPYVPTGDMATVIKLDKKDLLVALNRGEKDGVKVDQKIVLKKEGKVVSEIQITQAGEDFAVGQINTAVAVPETIEVGDLYEMGAPEVVNTGSDKPAAPGAPAAKPAKADA